VIRVRILYLSLSYVPSRRASSVQVMNMCAALARHGHDVTLVCKRSEEAAARGIDDHAFYGVPKTFRVDKVARPLVRGGGLLYMAGMASRVLRARDYDIVYCRDLVGALLAAERGLPVVFEAHSMPGTPFQQRGWRRLLSRPSLRGLVVISEALRRDAEAAGYAPAHAPVVVAHDAAEVKAAPPRSERRGGRPGRRIGYVGSLYPGRGVEMVADLARRLPDVCFDIVGGAESDLARWRATAIPENLTLHGFQPPSRLAEFYRGFDVVLLPHPRHGITGATGATDISKWTSPMKMFEYMASGVPVVASDLPVLQEILRHEENALIAPAGDVEAWQRAVERLLADPSLAERLGTAARADVEERYTWDARARNVVAGLGLA
jgi:glycosyltransferase involved in cell wall biosynthesis